MKKYIYLATLFLSTVSFAKDFGKGITSKEAPKSLSSAANELESLKNKEIVLKSNIEIVCQEMGCWMMLKDGETRSRVTFDNYAFFVPKDSAKKDALVQGKLFMKELSPSEARHYAKDEGKSKAEIAKIKAPVKSLWFEATGVRIE